MEGYELDGGLWLGLGGVGVDFREVLDKALMVGIVAVNGVHDYKIY